MLLMFLGRSGVIGSVSAHILPAWLRARQVLSGCGGRGGGGGIMTAESISASRDGVRSKSRCVCVCGGGIRGGAAMRLGPCSVFHTDVMT